MQLELVQNKTTTTISTLNDLRSTIQPEEGITTSQLAHLKDTYSSGIDLSSEETKLIQNTIERLTTLTRLREASEPKYQKKKKRKHETQGPTASSATKKVKSDDDIYPPGAHVAARQLKQKNKTEEWILAVVLEFYADKNKYQVEDVEQDDDGHKQRYMLPPKNVIAVPEPADLKNIPESTPGQVVLALYPGTTCFYRATVIKSTTNKDGLVINYQVQFEDDNDEIKTVQNEHVLQIPKGKH
ncbi:unnamed protein product [Absidia cylindrospora]